ncbi:hypothetical protein, unknown function [Leishmania tarentolae]|uniref:Uncharacterized protein n=1 Tax=Leishmania tarentolae TaxID=5689 RepID=A0A640KAL0_LEITA|nr:hypothetical protein, unknown function [Leishmania tarentolae]
MRDSCRAQTPPPSHFLSQDCERAASHDFGSGGGDPTARLNSNTSHLRQRSHYHHHQVPWRESHSTSALEGNGNGRGSVGCCAVSTWANALPNAGGGVGMIVNTSQLSSPSLCAAAAVNPPSGRSTSSSTRYRQREAAGCPTSEAASTAPDATVAFAPSASRVASGVAVSRTQCSDHNSTRAAERVEKVSLRGASGAAATPEPHCALRETSGHPQESSSTSLRLYASASTAPSTATRGNLADPKLHGRLLPPSIMSEVARASGRRSCSCPNIRSTTVIGAAIVSIPLAICTSVAASTRAASAVTHPARILGSTGSLPRPTNMRPQKLVPPTAPDFKPLGLWNTSAASAAAASTL